jgi:hypothetical protein
LPPCPVKTLRAHRGVSGRSHRVAETIKRRLIEEVKDVVDSMSVQRSRRIDRILNPKSDQGSKLKEEKIPRRKRTSAPR